MKTYFFTCVVSGRKVIFSREETDRIRVIVDSAKFFVSKEGFELHALSIMPNHLHWLYSVDERIKDFQKRMLRYTTKKLIELNRDSRTGINPIFQIERSDRKHQVWRKGTKLILVKSSDQYFAIRNYILNNHLNPFWVDTAFHQHFDGLKFSQRLWPSARRA